MFYDPTFPGTRRTPYTYHMCINIYYCIPPGKEESLQYTCPRKQRQDLWTTAAQAAATAATEAAAAAASSL